MRAPPRRRFDPKPVLWRGVMLKQRTVDPLEIIADMIEQVGGTLDDQIEKDEEGVARAGRNAVVALLRQPREPPGPPLGHSDERALGSNELHGDQLRPTHVKAGEQWIQSARAPLISED